MSISDEVPGESFDARFEVAGVSRLSQPSTWGVSRCRRRVGRQGGIKGQKCCDVKVRWTLVDRPPGRPSQEQAKILGSEAWKMEKYRVRMEQAEGEAVAPNGLE